jgi:hypothetical protein
MHKRTKLWSSLSLAALVGSGPLAVHAQGAADAAPAAATGLLAGLGGVEGAEGAEGAEGSIEGGEGGEGEGAPAALDPATSDVAYLTQLGLMRGHLLVGLELYRAGHLEHARTHMKHPESELYADLVPAFNARGTEGFASALSALAEAVNSDDSSAEEVEAAYRKVLEGIAGAEALAAPVEPTERLQVAVNLVRTAAEEYAIGVVDGEVVNAHEYQDALGFTRTAESLVDGIDPGDDAELAAGLERVDAYLGALLEGGTWPDVMPPARVEGEASALFGAAARIEIVALGLR